MTTTSASTAKTAADFAAAIRERNAAQLGRIPKSWHIPSADLPPPSRANIFAFPLQTSILTPADRSILSIAEASDLLNLIATGKLTCLAVIMAFCKAAAIAHQLTNCLTEIYFEEAMERARGLDKVFGETGKGKGLLFGLPVSLKDQFQIEGKECNMGIASWIGQISEENSVLVDILLDAGAVIHCRTNVPQALMFAESDNYVYGRTINPRNRTLTSGGSSGGEGALVAMHGSIIGVGTDLGGSVRIPAAYNGLYGLRPTLHRLPYSKARNTLLGLESVASSLGPLSNSLSGISLFVSSVLSARPWFLDPKTPEIPWRQEMADLKHLKNTDGEVRKPVFGVLRWDEYVMPWPPLRRALDMVVDGLEKAGYEVVAFPVPFPAEKAESIVQRVYSSDGGLDLQKTLAPSGEPRHPMMVTDADVPHLSVYESWQLNLEKDAVRDAWLKAWNDTASKTSTGQAIDGLILPPGSNVAHKHGEWSRNFIYTSLFNMIDYPAMVIPVRSTVDPILDPIDQEYKAANATDEKIWAEYSPYKFADAPITVQLVCRRYREEECIGLAGVIQGVLKAS